MFILCEKIFLNFYIIIMLISYPDNRKNMRNLILP